VICGAGGGIEKDGDVGAAGHQPFAQPQAQSFHHGDAGLRKLRVEALDEVGRDDVRHARRQADGQAAARVALALRHVGAGAVGQFLDGAGMHQQCRAGFRGNGAAAVPLQQPLADLRFEQLHLAAERGLGQVQGGRRTAEAAGLGHGGEVLQAGQVHRMIMCCGYSW
jgi:hypothetical protein